MGDLDKTLQAIASLCPKNIPELERLPVVELQVGDQCLLIWSEQKEVWRVKSFCTDGDVDIVCEKFNAHMAVPKNELRLVIDFQQSKIEQLETKNKALVHALVNTNAEKTKLAHDYWNQAERLAEYCSMLMSSESELTVSCFQKEKKIEQLGKRETEITRLVQGLRNEFDLNSDCPQVERQIELLEKALRGECD